MMAQFCAIRLGFPEEVMLEVSLRVHPSSETRGLLESIGVLG